MGGGEWKNGERGGLLIWLEWLFCSCAIICGGGLRAALQDKTVLEAFVENWLYQSCPSAATSYLS